MNLKPACEGASSVFIGLASFATKPTKPSPIRRRVLCTEATSSPSVAHNSSVLLSTNKYTEQTSVPMLSAIK